MKEFSIKSSILMLVALSMMISCSVTDEANAPTTAQQDYLSMVKNYSAYSDTVAGTGELTLAYGSTNEFDSNTVPIAKFDGSGNITLYTYKSDSTDVLSIANATFIDYTIKDGGKYKLSDGTYIYVTIDVFTKRLRVISADELVEASGISTISTVTTSADNFSDEMSDSILVETTIAEHAVQSSIIKEKFNDIIISDIPVTQNTLDTSNLLNGTYPLGHEATITIGNFVPETENELKTTLHRRNITIKHGAGGTISSVYATAFPEGVYTYDRVVTSNGRLIFKGDAATGYEEIEVYISDETSKTLAFISGSWTFYATYGS